MLIKLLRKPKSNLHNFTFFESNASITSEWTDCKVFHTPYSLLLIFLLILISININTIAQTDIPENLVTIKTIYPRDSVYAGDEVKITVKTTIEKGWHINSNKPNEDYLIPSVLKINSQDHFKLISVKYPKAKELKFEFSDNPVSVFEREISIIGIIKVPEAIDTGKYTFPVILNYQACNNSTCLPPSSVKENLIFIVAEKKISEDTSKINEVPVSEPPAQVSGTTLSGSSNGNSVESSLATSGFLVSILIVFLGGLALNLTPCVYPLIPITVGYFGGQSEGSTGKLFLLGLLYVLGMAITYSVVGVVTALSGAIFGSLLQNTFVVIGIAAVLVALSLSMFGLYEFKLPDSLVAKAGGAKGGYFGAVFMGLTMGIVAAPCIGPFVLGLVTYVGSKGDPYYGFLMFFFLAIGLGFPYIFLALFSGKIKSLPRAGIWMNAVKLIFGFILLGMALYFLLPILPQSWSGSVLPVYMIIAALYIIFFDKSADKLKGFKYFKNAFSVIVIAAAVYLIIPAKENSPAWQKFTSKAYQKSLTTNKPMILDFYADWCIPCKELDAETYSNTKVIDESKRFNAYKIDMTKTLSVETEQIRKMFKIVGMPTVIIINSKGEEIKRITGFINTNEMLKILKSVN